MSIIFKGMEMPPTGNYFVMVENDPGFPPNATIWKRKKDGSLEHFAFARIEEIQHHGDLIDVSKVVLEYGGLAKIPYFDYAGTAEYFADQIRRQPIVIPADSGETNERIQID